MSGSKVTEFVAGMFGVEGKVVAVTGAGGHLCGTMALGLAKAGAKVVAMDLRPEKLQPLEVQIDESGGDFLGLELDVRERSQFEAALKSATEKFGRVDVLINGSGINSASLPLEIQVDDWDAIFDVNLRGTLLGCQVFGEHMLENGSGSIINISSASSGPPLSKAFAYSASKAGVKNLTANLGREWATRGVRVNALRPGFFPTEWNRENFITPEREAAILGHTPMGRFGEPEELLGAVIWLASDASQFVTGTEVVVDGGFTAMTI
tara:strand:+ start:1234 stop:2028 length:795 start_codon:yes stop_codon:yes gene_type:complete